MAVELIERWDALLDELGVADGRATGSRLLGRWAEPHRHYHDVAHLTAVLDAVDLLAEHASDPAAVRLAAWYHDAIYAGNADDEEQSAQLAQAELSALGLPAGLVAEVVRLVRLTATHSPPPADRNGEVLCDADLSVLASPAEDYRRYVEAVRAEYAHVPDREFRAGRARILISLVAMSALFRTAAGRERWEDAARANVRTELAELTGSQDA